MRYNNLGLGRNSGDALERIEVNRLATFAPSLAKRLKTVDARSQRAAAFAAALWASRIAELDQPAVVDALDKLHAGTHEAVEREDLARLVEELDEAAWAVQDAVEAGSASTADYVVAFGRARAVASVLFATDPNAEAAALEATYEASVVVDDRSALVGVVERALDRS